MKSRSETQNRGMPSAAIGAIVAVIVLAVVAGLISITNSPSLPIVSGAPVIDNTDPENAELVSPAAPDPDAPDAFVEQSGQFVTPADTDDETTVVDTELEGQ